MLVLFRTLDLLLWLYVLILLARVVIDLVQIFSREWRPQGAMLVVANVVYGLTDPPLRFVRRFVPPLRLGQVQLDLVFLILFFAVQLVRGFILPMIFRALI
jgi:YggT family protein